MVARRGLGWLTGLAAFGGFLAVAQLARQTDSPGCGVHLRDGRDVLKQSEDL